MTTINIYSAGNGTTDPSGSFWDCPSVITAIPDEGYEFDYWQLDEATISNSNPLLDCIPNWDPFTITAYFREIPPPTPHTLTIATDNSDFGTTQDPSPGTYQYDEGTWVSVTAVPNSGYEFCNWIYDDTTTVPNPMNVYMGTDHTLTACFTRVVTSDGLLTGEGSKQTTITSQADTIIRLTGNFSNPDKNALIQNLVIYGNGNNTAIKIEDACGTLIKNISIRNCDVGIKLTATGTCYDEATKIEHVRMTWVNTGIQFLKGTGTGSFNTTFIDDVGISLKDSPNLKGIEVGANCVVYSSYINANVWSTQSCYGLWIDGQINYSLVSFNHERTTGSGGTGVYISSIGSIVYGHSFFLSTHAIGTPVSNNSNPYVNDYISSASY